MTRLVSRWTALCAWAALMGIVWAVFVPRGLSASSFTLLSLTGPLFLVAGSWLWSAHQPTPSFGQARFEAETAETTAPVRR